MFIDWQDGEGNWHTLKKPSYYQIHQLYFRVNQLIPLTKGIDLKVAYDSNPQVEFIIGEILKILELSEEEIDMDSLYKLLIDPALLLRRDGKKEEDSKPKKEAKPHQYEELIASLWLSNNNMEDVMFTLKNFTPDEIIEISDARSRLSNPEAYQKRKVKDEAKAKMKERMSKFQEKHNVNFKKEKNAQDTDKEALLRKRRLAAFVEQNKRHTSKPEPGTKGSVRNGRKQPDRGGGS